MFPLRLASVIPLKYPKSEKNEFFDPHFLRMEGHMMAILIALDELYDLCFLSLFVWSKVAIWYKKHDF
jgi:hypothetical protein